MPKSRRPYPPEYRERIIELVRSGRSPESFPLELPRQLLHDLHRDVRRTSMYAVILLGKHGPGKTARSSAFQNGVIG